MFVDCFIFNDELRMLEFRLNELNDVVDYIVLVESPLTHSGLQKPLHYQENRHLFSKYNDKICHVVVDDSPQTDDPWVREKHQRDCISRGLAELALAESDYVIISDCDEIPDPSLLEQISIHGFNIFQDEANSNFLNQPVNDYKFDSEIVGLLQDMYYYNLECKCEIIWWQSRVLTYRTLHILGGPEKVRRMDLQSQFYKNAGWHFSYFGGIGNISNKLKSFAHQEYNLPEFTNHQSITESISNGKDLFNRDFVQFKHVSIEDNEYLPAYYKMILD